MIAIKAASSGFFELNGSLHVKGTLEFNIAPDGRVVITKTGDSSIPETILTGYVSDFYDGDLGGDPVPLDQAGFINKIGAVALAGLSMGGGDATAANQSLGNASLASIDGKLPSKGSATEANSIPVVIASDQTVPVSVSGGATAANQATGNASLGNLDTNIGAKADASATTDTGTFSLISLIKRLVAKIPGLGSAASASSLPVVIANDQSAVPVSLSGVATSANQSAGNTSLASIDTKLSSQATATNQATANTSLSSIDGKIPAKGAATIVNSTPVNIASDQTVPVSISGIATAANQNTGNTSLGNLDTNLGAKADASATTDTGNFSLIALIKRLVSKIPGLGSATSANSLPVVIASDQASVSVTVAASENHIGEIGGSTDIISITPTITAGAYTSGQVVGGVQTFAAAMRINNGKGVISSISVMDKGNQKAPLDILIFSQNPTTGTYTDHAALQLNSTDSNNIIRKITIATADYTSYATSGTSIAIADISNISKAVKSTGGNTSLYAVIVCQGTPTFASTSDLTIKLGFFRD